jgi:pilus assembly protein FimV
MKTSLKARLIATAIAALPGVLPSAGLAAGLGAINVYSALGQPLRAEIELQATPQELQTLSARVASVDAFRQANVGYSPLMAGLQFSVEMRGNRPVVKVTSARPVQEPFLEMLVELQWANGRLLREYTFLLDPAEAIVPAPVAATVAAPTAAVAPPVQAAAAERRPAPVSEYRVRRGDTLRSIANAHRVSGANLDQMLIALLRQNPDAFDENNINRLRAGAILTVPDAAAVQAIDAAQARREIVAQAADFEAYRNRLAGAVASRPAAAQQPASRESAGQITPRVADAPRPERAQDRVEVSGVPGDASDPGRLARLQALEEELVAREQSLEEANSRLAELEQSIRDLQRLIELRNQSLAQLQQQLAGTGEPPPVIDDAPAAEAAPGAATVAMADPGAQAEPGAATDEAPAADTGEPPPVIDEAPAADADVPQDEAIVVTAEPPVPAEAAERAVVQPELPVERAAPVQQPPMDQPTLLQALLDDPRLLAGGGGIVALLLGYMGYRVRQRRNDQVVADAAEQLSEYPASETKSVFGSKGGQSVDTGSASSALHTDFSQSGLSAIDADEGVDPVAEADVYMAYGRDAQAEEILLDALKADASRIAIYLKLLEIYLQRKNPKQFEAVATDLHSRTGGQGEEWARAAEMGRRLDPDNALYGSKAGAGAAQAKAGGGRPAQAAGLAAAAAGAAALTITDPADALHVDAQSTNTELEDLDFSPPSAAEASPTQLKDTWAMPGGAERLAAIGADAAAGDEAAAMAGESPSAATDTAARLPEVDFSVLDFDLGTETEGALPASPAPTGARDAETASAAQQDVGAATQADDLLVDLELTDKPVVSTSPSKPSDEDEALKETLIGGALPFEASTEEFDLIAEAHATPATGSGADGGLDWLLDQTPAPAEADLSATVVQTDDPVAGDAPPATDLERTEFDNQLLDFDFDLDGITGEARSEAPVLDLSDIDLELEPPADEAAAAIAARGEGAASDDEPSAEVVQEVATKLDLARAYEEMGDKEGARELIEEVLREGSTSQREAATRLLERLD